MTESDSNNNSNSNNNSKNDKLTIAKLSAQLKKMNEANGKYKNLLKLAKERIQQQETELSNAKTTTQPATTTDTNTTMITRICQCVQQPLSDGKHEIWALLESETINENDEVIDQHCDWRKFATASELSDYVRRDSGEPIAIPPISLSPEQSQILTQNAQTKVDAMNQEFRRFRVQAALAQKTADAQLRNLQTSKAKSITIPETNTNTDRLRAQMAAQEAHWQEAYNTLLEENKALQAAGSETLLASQWRQRYEQAHKEKEELLSRMGGNHDTTDGSDKKYERKYRDLKESFRLYRSKAKEIFESQNHLDIQNDASADAKLSYLRNLLAQYLAADPPVREHMEGAIGTVLQFTNEQQELIDTKRRESEAWF